MQFITAKQISEGMCVAQDVRDPQGRILIARGQRIGMHHIVRMRKFGIESLFIDETNGEAVAKPAKSELRKECEQVLSASFSNITKEFAEKKITLDAAAIQQATEHLLLALLKCKNPLVTLQELDAGSDRLMQHSVNATVLATILAIDLRVPEPMLRDLATAMLFHDIGMLFVPKEVVEKPTPLTTSEVEEVRRHTEMGFEHLARTDAISSVSINVVLRHHELLNGMGYPQCVGGDKLSLLMRIASVVETYDSLTTPRFGVPAVLPDAALSYLLANAGKAYAKEVVAVLCRRVALYPKGTAVQLNSGEYGVVAGVLPTAPMRPVVLVQVNSQGKRLKDPLIVDLTADPGRSVARSAHTLESLLQDKEAAPAPKAVDPVYAGLG